MNKKNLILEKEGKLITSMLIFLLVSGVLAIFFYGLFVRTERNSSLDEGWKKVVEDNEIYRVSCRWSYRNQIWSYEAEIPIESYDYFSEKTRVNDYSEYVTNPVDDNWMESLANQFEKASSKQGWSDFERVSFVLRFVQSIPYASDKVTAGYDEYSRYPIETFVDQGGDCEDTSILFTSIIREMGYGTVLLELPEDNHMAAGVSVSDKLINEWNQPYALSYYSQGNKKYAYCETTGSGWNLGQLPERISGKNVIIVDVFRE